MDNQAFQLVADALKRIETKLDDVADNHSARIDSLESTRDKHSGAVKLLVLLASSASGFVSFLAAVFFKSH